MPSPGSVNREIIVDHLLKNNWVSRSKYPRGETGRKGYFSLEREDTHDYVYLSASYLTIGTKYGMQKWRTKDVLVGKSHLRYHSFIFITSTQEFEELDI